MRSGERRGRGAAPGMRRGGDARRGRLRAGVDVSSPRGHDLGAEVAPLPGATSSRPACPDHLAGGVRGALRGPVTTAKQ